MGDRQLGSGKAELQLLARFRPKLLAAVYHHDVNGVEQEGMELSLEYGTIDDSGKVTNTGEEELSAVPQTALSCRK